MKAKRWRVRVRRTIEDWVEVQADTAELAEQQALTLPGIVYVMTNYTMSAEKPIEGKLAGVEDYDTD
jgi:hypothetical protein